MFFNINFNLIVFIIISSLLNSCQFDMTHSLFNTSNSENILFFSENETSGFNNLNGNLQIGFAARTIVPINPTSLTGFGAPMRRLLPPDMTNIGNGATYCKPYTSIDKQPRVKAMLISGINNANKIGYYLLISYDVIAIPTDFNIKMMAQLKTTFPNLNLDQTNVQFVATHTHSGSAGLTENPFWAAAVCDRFNPGLYNTVTATTLQTVGDAYTNLSTPNAVDITNDQISGYNYSRFDGMQVDTNVYYMNFKDSGANSLGCFIAYSVHPTWYGIDDLVFSSDLAGYLENELQSVTGSKTCIFFNSTVGNASAVPLGDKNTYATGFIQEVLNKKVVGSTIPNQFQYGNLFIHLPNFKLNFAGCGLDIHGLPQSFIDAVFSVKSSSVTNNITKIAWFNIKGTYFFLFPGEPLYDVKIDFQTQLNKLFPGIQSYFFLSTSNDYIGYIMNSSNYTEKSMETCSTLHGPDTSSVVITGFMNALKAAGQ
ncbi:neutral/alkaline non-lysosomal ceramidase N-terminal domain-containing protein [Fluviispira multicolorata]|nr:neutral/alkaline non-lysosomal ceramidase N-terminal domain-containing protein [Fluviispira multicolorata]